MQGLPWTIDPVKRLRVLEVHLNVQFFISRIWCRDAILRRSIKPEVEAI